MPALFPFNSHGNNNGNHPGTKDFQIEGLAQGKPSRRQSLFKKPFEKFRNHHKSRERDARSASRQANDDVPKSFGNEHSNDHVKAPSRPPLRRPQTFRRQESEKREKLLEVQPTLLERRTVSVDRRRSRGQSSSTWNRSSSAQPMQVASMSAPLVGNNGLDESTTLHRFGSGDRSRLSDLPRLEIPLSNETIPWSADEHFDTDTGSVLDQSSLQEEFERRWILNLSMHFRDRSNREKFFVTFAERPNLWRRLTVSLDYREAIRGSLEEEMKDMVLQRDKSYRIYEAIRDSLPDIQFYDTVTNLKLQTTPEDDQLHVHVREDTNEIVEYPALSLFRHISCSRYNESTIEFDSHLSGFVYKVRLNNRILIKKEIPGPDTIEEFLYEVNALDALRHSENVIRLEGLVTDDHGEKVKGLLISYAEQGALVDMLYDFDDLPWHRREKWAKQIVTGLSEIHEAGFIQGDFTLSNVVIDESDNARVIDINRRGCPVGWEPPEFEELIASGQRIGMRIGTKTDLFQLGMVLWALAEQQDEPEREERPLLEAKSAPAYLREMIKICLSEKPQGRESALSLLKRFPDTATAQPASASVKGRSTDRTACPAPSHDDEEDISPYVEISRTDLLHSDLNFSHSSHRSGKVYIDPTMAVTIEDCQTGHVAPHFDFKQVEYVKPASDPTSASYRLGSVDSWSGRGRSSHRRRPSSPFAKTAASSATSVSDELRSSYPTQLEIGQPPPALISSTPTVQGKAMHTLRRKTPDATLHLKQQEQQQQQHFLHTDSGFDETMVENIETDMEGSQTTEKEFHVKLRPQSERTTSWDSTVGAPTPDSFCTAHETSRG